MSNSEKIALVVLAAGSSSRMNAVKQLLPWKNSTLLGHTLEMAEQSLADHCYVVLGSNADKIQAQLTNSKLKSTVILNKNWNKGIGSSIGCAINYLQKQGQYYDAILIALGDQPLITSDHYNNLINKFTQSEKSIIATAYDNGQGVPALFGSQYFTELKTLHEDFGAKKVMQSNNSDIDLVPSGVDTSDIDTPGTYKSLFQKFGKV